jgi:hypothetical protein
VIEFTVSVGMKLAETINNRRGEFMLFHTGRIARFPLWVDINAYS